MNEVRPGKNADILVEPNSVDEVVKSLKASGLQPVVLSDNVQKLFDAERRFRVAEEIFSARDDPSKFPFNKFNKFDAIVNWLKAVESKYDFVKTFKIGTSTEGRDFYGVKIAKPSADGKTKNGFWIDGGIHAREWMSPATVVYIINELTSKYGSDAEITKLVDGLDWMISPNLNPDGYVFTFDSDRMWRKTRSETSDPDCKGVDPNRNFDWHWGDDGGGSDDPCAEDFKGAKIFSEPECKAVGDALYANNKTLKAMLTVHTFGEDWLVPYGYCLPTVFPPDYDELLSAANEGAKAIVAAGGPEFAVGNSAELLYPATGASDDFSKGAAGIKYVYTVELGDSFTQPDTEIIGTASSAWAGFRVIAERVLKLPPPQQQN